jgi:hypothetical protein
MLPVKYVSQFQGFHTISMCFIILKPKTHSSNSILFSLFQTYSEEMMLSFPKGYLQVIPADDMTYMDNFDGCGMSH